MTRTVKFNYKFCLSRVKICNIFAKHFLTRKSNGMCTQEIIPQMFFLFCHIFSQSFSNRDQLFVVFSLHCTIPPPRNCSAPPFTQGRLGAWHFVQFVSPPPRSCSAPPFTQGRLGAWHFVQFVSPPPRSCSAPPFTQGRLCSTWTERDRVRWTIKGALLSEKMQSVTRKFIDEVKRQHF